MTTRVLSADAENSRELIQRTLSAHREVMLALARPGAARRRLPSRGVDREQLQRQATLVRLLSITEAFCTERLFAEMDGTVNPTGHAVVTGIWNAAFDGATGSWHGQKEAFKTWLNVDRGLWTQVMDLTEARNAVAHGYGQLTHRQRRKQRSELETKLRAHAIALNGDFILLTEESITNAADTCRTFIKALDDALASSP